MTALRFRQIAPLVLIGLIGLVAFESWIPGADYLRQQFGDTFVLRFAVITACAMLIVLLGEQLRMELLFKQVLEQFKTFHGKGGGAATPSPEQQVDAAKILIAALASSEVAVREQARENLKRIAGQDLGKDPAAWQRWLDQTVRQTGSDS